MIVMTPFCLISPLILPSGFSEKPSNLQGTIFNIWALVRYVTLAFVASAVATQMKRIARQRALRRQQDSEAVRLQITGSFHFLLI